MVLALSSRFLSEKNWRILWRNSSFPGQDSIMLRVFSMAAHPKRQLGSASESIQWLKALCRLCPERSLCRHIATCLFACWCYLMVPNLDLIFMQLFLEVYWLRRRLVAHLALNIEANSLGKWLILTLSPSWVLHSIAASLSSLSFPSIPV
jgi:hypothetical protein